MEVLALDLESACAQKDGKEMPVQEVVHCFELFNSLY